MRSVVSIPCLVREILECVTSHWQDAVHWSYHELATCARVSRVWHNEACSILWFTQYGFQNLLRLLKSGFPADPMGRCLASAGIPNVTRLLHYSQWIRKITCSNHGLEDLGNASILADRLCLFPSLKSLRIPKMQTMPFRKSALTATICLLSTSLEELDLGHGSAEMTTFILAHIIRRNCCLARVSINCMAMLKDERAVFCKFVKSSPKLQEVGIQISWLNYDVVEALGQLPQLSTLQINDNQDDPFLVESTNIRDIVDRLSESAAIRFRSLKRLHLTGNLFAANKLLKTAFTHCSLETYNAKFEVTSHDINGSGGKRQLFDAFDNYAHTLVSVEVFLDGKIATQIPRLDKHSFHGLSSCGALEVLSVYHPRIPKLNDTDVLSLAKGWPTLHKLDLCGRSVYQPGDMPQITLAVLDELPKLCPKLAYLTMEFSGTTPSLSPGHNRHPVAFKRIDIGSSFIFDPVAPSRRDAFMRIAAYLRAVLPLACTVDYGVDFGFRQISHLGISTEEWCSLVEAHEQNVAEFYTYWRFSTMTHEEFGTPPPQL